MNFKKAEKFIRYRILPGLLRLFLRKEKVPEEVLSRIKPRNILLVKVHHKMGDLLLATPLPANLKKKFPKAKIDFLAGSYNYPALLSHPCLDSVFVYHRKKGVFRLLRLVRQLRQKQYDLGIVVSASSFSVTNSLLAYFCRPRILFGFEAPVKNRLKITDFIYSRSLPAPEKKINEALFYLKLLEPLSIRHISPDEVMGISREERSFAKEWYEKNAPEKTGILVGIHPGGTYPERRWGTENFQTLVSRFLENRRVRIVLFWGPGEEEEIGPLLVNEKVRAIPPCSFRNLAALQERLCLFIGNDTGTLHSAAGVGIPAIGLYISTDPRQWKPLNRDFHAMVRPSVSAVYKTARRIIARLS